MLTSFSRRPDRSDCLAHSRMTVSASASPAFRINHCHRSTFRGQWDILSPETKGMILFQSLLVFINGTIFAISFGLGRVSGSMGRSVYGSSFSPTDTSTGSFCNLFACLCLKMSLLCCKFRLDGINSSSRKWFSAWSSSGEDVGLKVGAAVEGSETCQLL